MQKKLEGARLKELLDIIERNRWEVIRKHHISKDPESDHTNETKNEEESNNETLINSSDVQVVLFAALTPFSESIITMFSKETVIARFEDPEKAIRFCCDNAISYVLLDLDPPTDGSSVLDVFSALKILHDPTTFFAFTKFSNSVEAISLHKRGSHIIEKPVFRKQVLHIVNRYVKSIKKQKGSGIL